MPTALLKHRSQDWPASLKLALRSKDDFLKFIETKESLISRGETRNQWSNGDLEISLREDWTWAW